ncbi:Bax inhibitor-1/YccA family protein [Cryobacterium melibiosiphilum]|uniref:Bax inhibitor-1/YccA family protein n=1 Tax=Cryobacterium melibiosiphilum TaxID=995039 RepID=A0A3A5MTL7_9MICO|nr:Bax inhibitor-1/YccA family protein [Cryobacterium melibiosiphilum]RJT90543.1 Bax inhibitor-1/YccA family protein [Cryobacterium melibiosiphilum]
MATSNPAFSRNAAFGAPGALAASRTLSDNDLQDMYNKPSAGSQDTGHMTYEDTITKTGIAFAVLIVAAAVGWMFPILMIPGAIAGFVLGLVNTFKKEPSAPLILTFAAAQGLFVGGISMLFNGAYQGIVTQAILATLVVVGVTLALFRSGKIRASKKATKVFIIAMVGYGVFQLINLGLMVFTGADTMRSGWFGVAIGLFAVILAAYSLVLDFDFVQKGVQNRAPRKYGWSAAFGIVLTVVWLYVELLRIFAILRGE